VQVEFSRHGEPDPEDDEPDDDEPDEEDA
jgi:hypothetical protein